MSYGKFKSVSEVARLFDISVEDDSFIGQRSLEVPELYFSDISKNLRRSTTYINEFTVCEVTIRPILDIVASFYDNLNIWSHIPYNIDSEKGLVGEPDYLVAPKTKYGDMDKPVLCVIEVKQEKFDEGWAQALAEMVAASIQGVSRCYSMVTTGKAWEFGRLENQKFTKDTDQISATSDLQKVFDTVNWLFFEMDSSIS